MKNLRTYGIIDYLKQKKYCSVEELTSHFHVSNATMYRDIADLAARNIIKKVHGGIALQERNTAQKIQSSPYQERIDWNRHKKELIATKALERIVENDILFLDSSTTVYYLAKILENHNSYDFAHAFLLNYNGLYRRV